MTIFSLKFEAYSSICTSFAYPTANPSFVISCLKLPVLSAPSSRSCSIRRITASSRQNLKSSARIIHVSDNSLALKPAPRSQNRSKQESLKESSKGYSRFVILSAASVGLMALLVGFDVEKALALGPEGPLMEEFWDNVRRYALYALTVSTGAIYTVFQPILELLKNPISALLILIIIGGSIYVVSQVLSAMVGVTDFTYDYGY